MLLSLLILLIGFIGSALGPQQSLGFVASYVIYTVCRFLMACGTRGINETGYVLALELVSNSKRSHIGIGFEYWFAIGQLILVLVAYFVRDWRYLALIMAFLTAPFLSYALILPESPRWLISNNKIQDAHKIMKRIAKVNKREFHEEKWQQFANNSLKNEQQKETFVTLVKSLIKYPMQLVLLFTMFFNWLVNNFVFYGVGLKSVDLGVNPYVSFSISAAVEILAFTTILLIIDRFGRKKPYFVFLMIAGVSCISNAFTTNVYAGFVFAMIGKYAVSASYAVLRLYSNEIFPTSIRNSCIGACSMISRMGVIIAPVINSLGETGWKPLPFLIFGIFSLLASLSTILLPETMNRKLPENIEDAHKLNKVQIYKSSSSASLKSSRSQQQSKENVLLIGGKFNLHHENQKLVSIAENA